MQLATCKGRRLQDAASSNLDEIRIVILYFESCKEDEAIYSYLQLQIEYEVLYFVDTVCLP